MDVRRTGRRVGLVMAGGVLVATGLGAPAIAAGSAPGAPRSVAAAPGDGQATVSWQPPASTGGSPITSYQATCGAVTRTTAASARSVAVTGLTNGTTYSCSVTATNANGTGQPSAPVSVTPAGKPTSPRSVTNVTSGTGMTVRWLAPSSAGGSPVTGYAVSCASTDGGAALSGHASASDVKLTITGVPSNKTYRCNVTAENANGASGAALSNGWAMHAVTTSTAGTVRMHFPASVGKQITATASHTTFGPSGCAAFQSVDPAGSVLYDGCLYDDEDNVLTRESPSTATGTATVVVASPAGNTGAADLNSYVFSDFTSTVRADGSASRYSFGYPGQSGTLTFSATAGQMVSLLYTASTIVQTGYTSLRAPDGTELNFTGEFDTSFMDATTLPTTGTYTLAVDHGYGLGAASFNLYTVPTDTGTITRQGPAVTVALTVPGENATRTFTGAVGQTVTVAYNPSVSSGEVDLIDPSGSVIAYNYLYNEPGTTFRTDTVTLTKAGTYTVSVDPSSRYTGTVKLRVTS